ncbi:Membrane protein [Candidatus Desulfarcum epimagneticum]|uniref:Membrane protein n=1 Tax=uncultured Desulfobacteraceae bacterium TaxID=218296 RepID=A0A484HJP0_9BACT|nr:Membrane protein [uncultured Desulfobacteraceae bacterium]
MNVYEALKESLKEQIQRRGLSGRGVSVRCEALSAEEAIGRPEHDDYPIVRGREVMVEAVFEGARGQAFSDDFENTDLAVDDLLDMRLDSNRKRAVFVAALNAVFRRLGLCGRTIHCKDDEPARCADCLPDLIEPGKKVLLAGHQPRFLEILSSHGRVRAVDLDEGHIGSGFCGVTIEPPEATPDAIEWSDLIFATGSTLVNGTIGDFLDRGRPVVFYGVTISAAAVILNLRRFCRLGR